MGCTGAPERPCSVSARPWRRSSFASSRARGSAHVISGVRGRRSWSSASSPCMAEPSESATTREPVAEVTASVSASSSAALSTSGC
jgi:hypothetical protein